MLVISRSHGEKIVITSENDPSLRVEFTVRLTDPLHRNVRLSFDAPQHVRIRSGELPIPTPTTARSKPA